MEQSFRFQSNFKKGVYHYTSCGFSYMDVIRSFRLVHRVVYLFYAFGFIFYSVIC